MAKEYDSIEEAVKGIRLNLAKKRADREKKNWYFFPNYFVKGSPNKNLKTLGIIYGTRKEARQQAFTRFGTEWVEYAEKELKLSPPFTH